jgi:DNA-binding NarL/FixJ family response regulator
MEIVATGASNKAVAASLRCSESTVEFHVTALLGKTDCESRAALAACFWKE